MNRSTPTAAARLFTVAEGALEEGVITSFNPAYVFVRYGADAGSKATLRKDLEWVAGSVRETPKSGADERRAETRSAMRRSHAPKSSRLHAQFHWRCENEHLPLRPLAGRA